jgi:hypothetical protein
MCRSPGVPAIVALLMAGMIVFAVSLPGIAADKFGRGAAAAPSPAPHAARRATGPDASDQSRVVYDLRDLATFNEGVTGEDWQANLSAAIKATVEPESWDGSGGIGALARFDGTLIVSQSSRAHSQIVAVLTGLRRARADQPDDAAADPVRAALDRPISVDLEDSLSGALGQIAAMSGVEFEIDWQALSSAGISGDATITLRADDAPLRELLAELLTPRDLDWFPGAEALVVTTAERAAAERFPRVYDVRELAIIDAGGERPSASLMALIQTVVAPESWDSAESAAMAPVAGALVVRQGHAQHAEIAAFLAALRRMVVNPHETAANASPTVGLYRLPVREAVDPTATHLSDGQGEELQALRAALMATIARESWDQWGGPGSIIEFGDLLVVRQGETVQAQIAEVLEQIARIRASR